MVGLSLNTVSDGWGFFSPGGSWINGCKAWTLGSPIQILGILFFVLLFASIFIFKPWYRFLMRHRAITTTIGFSYLMMYVVYFVIQITYFYTTFPNYVQNFSHFNLFTSNLHNLRPKYGPSDFHGAPPIVLIQDIMPLHVSSAGEICAATLLITRNKKLFNTTFPLFGFLPILAVFAPAKVYWGMNDYFYYDYYFVHSWMITVYWIFYLYGIQKYNFNFFRFTMIFGSCLILTAFSYDWIFNTDLLYVGANGYQFAPNLNSNDLFGLGPSRWMALVLTWLFGLLLVWLGYILIGCFKPFYAYISSHQAYSKDVLYDRNMHFLSLKKLFIWDESFFKSIRE